MNLKPLRPSVQCVIHIVLVPVFAVLAVVTAPAADAPWRAGSSIVQVEVRDATGSLRLQELVDDVWQIDPEGATCLVRPEERAALAKAGFAWRDLYPSLDDYRRAVFGSLAAAEAAQAAYQRYPELVANLDSLVAAHPAIARRIVIGTSVQGREIVGVRISRRPEKIDLYRHGIAWVGVHHAREWISLEVPYLLAKHLLEQYGTDPDVTRAVDTREIWIVPCLNPDGLEWTHDHDRLWRKNLRDNDTDGVYGENGDGVDLNRNYAYGFGGPGSSGIPSSETYRGPGPLSEPETSSYEALFQLRPFDFCITYHSYGQLVLYPWGNQFGSAPDKPLLDRFAVEMANRIRSVHGRSYTPQQAAQLYLTSGDTCDHLYGIYGIPGYTIEMRPPGGVPGFELPPEEILPTFEENRPAAMFTLDLAPDLAITGISVTEGDPAEAIVTLANLGNVPAQAEVRLYLDGMAPGQRVYTSPLRLLDAGQTGVQVTGQLPAPSPGPHRLFSAVVSRLVADARPANNQAVVPYPPGSDPGGGRLADKHTGLVKLDPGGAVAPDGDLEEWDASRRVLALSESANADHVSGTPSVALELYAAWDDEALYLAGRAIDPGEFVAGGPPLSGDGCVIRIDRADAGGWYRPEHYSLLLEGAPAAPSLRVRRGSGADGWNGAGIGWPAGVAALATEAGGYVFECAIAWDDLGGPPLPGDRWGWDVSCRDVDAASSGEVFWDGDGDDADRWGRATFTLPGLAPLDFDHDGILDGLETANVAADRPNRWLPDSDGDGLGDAVEDRNRDGARDAGETNPRDRDSDADAYSDGVEVLLLESDPLDAGDPGVPASDPDQDGLPDGLDLDPNNPDLDGDRFADGYEAVTLGLEAMADPGLAPPLADTNADGFVTNLDALMTQAIFIQSIAPDEAPGIANADPSCDGFVSNVDALLIQTFFLGLRGTLPL